MLDYARQRASEALGTPRSAVLVTSGPAGVQTGEFPCETIDLNLYLLVPQTSDHLFNLEHNAVVTLLTAGCELKGKAHLVSCSMPEIKLELLQELGAKWCALVQVEIFRVQVRSGRGWKNSETIDL